MEWQTASPSRTECDAAGRNLLLRLQRGHRLALKLNDEAVRAGAQTDLDDLGIAKNAREEKLAARKHKDAPEKEEGLGGKKKASEPAEVLHKPTV